MIHFFFFFGFFIFKLAGGIGILSPSSLGSVILDIFLIIFKFLLFYFTSFIFSSVMLGVKFIRIVFWPGYVFIWSKKPSVSLYKLLASRNSMYLHFLNIWWSWSETWVKPPNLSTLRLGNPSTCLFFPFYPIIKLLTPSSLTFSQPVKIIYSSFVHIPSLPIKAFVISATLLKDKSI